MSVYKEKTRSTYRYDFLCGGVRFSGSTGRTSKADAKRVEAEKRAEAEVEVARIKSREGAPLTMEVAVQRYFAEVGTHHKNWETTLTDLERLTEFFGKEKRLEDIRDDDIAKLVAWRRGQKVRGRKKGAFVSPATVNRSTTEMLQKLFNRAGSTWRVPLLNAPVWKKHLLPEPQERAREVRGSEEASLDVIPVDYRMVVAFARASGLRMDSCLLRKDEVDLVNGRVTTVGKGGKTISQPITDEMRKILMAAMANPTEVVFTYAAARAGRGDRTHKRGDRLAITLSGLKTIWRRGRARGLPKDLRFHDLRHDFATKLLRETGNLKLVSKALHHSKLETTNRYAHVLDEEILAGMEAASRSRQQNADAEREKSFPPKVPHKTTGNA